MRKDLQLRGGIMSIHCQSNKRIGNCKEGNRVARMTKAGDELFKFVCELERCAKSLKSFDRCAEMRDRITDALDQWVKAKREEEDED